MTTLTEIFARQRELMDKFEVIEHTSGLLDWRGSIEEQYLDAPAAQQKFRRYAWNITEEVTEAMDLIWLGSKAQHEIADAFHYLIELFLVADFVPPYETLEDAFKYHTEYTTFTRKSADHYWLVFLVQLGRTMNLLKNRPHKRFDQSKPVDVGFFRSRLVSVFDSFIEACIYERVTPEMLAASYFEKAAINDQRIAGTENQ